MTEETKFMAYRLPDGSWFQLQDLPWTMVEEIEQKHNTSWILVLDMPVMNGGILADIVRAVAIVNDLEDPTIETARDLAAYTEFFHTIDRDGRIVDNPSENTEEPAIAWSPTRV